MMIPIGCLSDASLIPSSTLTFSFSSKMAFGSNNPRSLGEIEHRDIGLERDIRFISHVDPNAVGRLNGPGVREARAASAAEVQDPVEVALVRVELVLNLYAPQC